MSETNKDRAVAAQKIKEQCPELLADIAKITKMAQDVTGSPNLRPFAKITLGDEVVFDNMDEVPERQEQRRSYRNRPYIRRVK